MARRQYFTVDEALSQLLAEEDDFLFGNGDSDSSGEDREEDVRQAQSLATPHSADRQAVLYPFLLFPVYRKVISKETTA